jgi:arginyl-tRNA--protein-N-Asp/Glu arginylyltransferase
MDDELESSLKEAAMDKSTIIPKRRKKIIKKKSGQPVYRPRFELTNISCFHLMMEAEPTSKTRRLLTRKETMENVRQRRQYETNFTCNYTFIDEGS